MAIKLRGLYRAFRAYKNSKNIGDFALLKADALGAKADPAVAVKMERVKGYHPVIALSKLSRLPPGTFGYEYASFIKDNRLTPLNISPELAKIAQDNVFALRYAVTHDMFHVLLGFDTSYAGEIGVLAFAVAQRYSKSQALSLVIAKYLYPLLAPRQFDRIVENVRRGKQMGEKADFLLNYRFEDNWAKPLTTIRQELNLR